MEIKAIETIYKGYKFRSRLEARWAVFFDSAEIPWEYEKEGYELSTGERYLPDFYLPRDNLFIEIKGENAEKEYMDKMARFAEESGKNILVVTGMPDTTGHKAELACFDDGYIVWERVTIAVNPSSKEYLWFEFKEEEKVQYYDDEAPQYLFTFFISENDLERDLTRKAYEAIEDFTSECIEAMNQARFEHGEKPQPKSITKSKLKKKKELKPKIEPELYEKIMQITAKEKEKKEAEGQKDYALAAKIAYDIIQLKKELRNKG